MIEWLRVDCPRADRWVGPNPNPIGLTDQSGRSIEGGERENGEHDGVRTRESRDDLGSFAHHRRPLRRSDGQEQRGWPAGIQRCKPAVSDLGAFGRRAAPAYRSTQACDAVLGCLGLVGRSPVESGLKSSNSSDRPFANLKSRTRGRPGRGLASSPHPNRGWGLGGYWLRVEWALRSKRPTLGAKARAPPHQPVQLPFSNWSSTNHRRHPHGPHHFTPTGTGCEEGQDFPLGRPKATRSHPTSAAAGASPTRAPQLRRSSYLRWFDRGGPREEGAPRDPPASGTDQSNRSQRQRDATP